MNLDCCAPASALIDYVTPQERMDPYKVIGREISKEIEYELECVEYLIGKGYKVAPPSLR